VIVKDPVTRGFYRFSVVQAAVLSRLDGKQEPGAIANAVSKESGTEVLPSQVEDFERNLQKLLLLDHPLVWARLERPAKPRHRLLGNMLSIKIHAFDPDALLTRLERRLSTSSGLPRSGLGDDRNGCSDRHCESRGSLLSMHH
jgi:hypothetical protein